MFGALALTLAGCGGGETVTGGPLTVHSSLPVPAPLKIHVSSPAFANGSRIPTKYTCSGENISPPLSWTGLPTATRAVAVLMVDPDAPGGPFTHWALADISPATRGLQMGHVPSGAVAGRNGFGKNGYGGPCPPVGRPHHYVIELMALPRRSVVSPGFASGELTGQRPLAAGVLRATYSRG
jgi:Raf kinase inhibitor-like YbhB/YbcL family protein